MTWTDLEARPEKGDPLDGIVLAFRAAVSVSNEMEPPYRYYSSGSFVQDHPDERGRLRPRRYYVWHIPAWVLGDTIHWLRDGWPGYNVEGLAIFGRVIDADWHCDLLTQVPPPPQ